MVILENITINKREFKKQYSDKGMMLEREGIMYSEAIDPAEFERQYTETDVPVEA